jgi:hypothetical protein
MKHDDRIKDNLWIHFMLAGVKNKAAFHDLSCCKATEAFHLKTPPIAKIMQRRQWIKT